MSVSALMVALTLLTQGTLAGAVPSSEAASLPEVTVTGFQPPSLGAFLTPLIKEKGLDKKNGLNIRFDLKAGKAVRADYASGLNKVDGSGAYLNHAQFRLKGLKTQFLFNVFDYYGALLTEKPGVKTLKDLAGRPMAAVKFSTNYWLFQFFAKRAGLELARMPIQSSEVPGVISLLMAGRVDAAHLWEPGLTLTEHRAPGRFRRIEYDGEWERLTGRRVNPYIAVAAHASWVQENRPLIPRLFATYKDAERFVAEQPGEAARVIARGTKLPEAALSEVIRAGRIRMRVAWAHELADDIRAVFEAARDGGALEGVPDPGIIYRP